jgi:3-oxoacyl-(acyl-carrier-protein) synthase
VDDGGGLEATAHANAAREHVFGFNRITMWERDRIPAETSDQLAEFADIAAALPQACSQLSSTLEQALASQELSMDSMTDESDPSMAIGVARLHLEEARGLAVDLHKHLNAARNATAHIISHGVDDGQESMPWDQP